MSNRALRLARGETVTVRAAVPVDIGLSLQAMFDAVAAAPMPRALEDLVDRLECRRLSGTTAPAPRYFDRRC